MPARDSNRVSFAPSFVGAAEDPLGFVSCSCSFAIGFPEEGFAEEITALTVAHAKAPEWAEGDSRQPRIRARCQGRGDG